jgi:lysophospholipase L1-like esterase
MLLKCAAIVSALLLFTPAIARSAQPSGQPANAPGPAPTIMAAAPIVLLGASFAAGWQLAPIAGHAVINHGVGGQETPQLLARFDRDVIAAKPGAVILWGYVNNIFNAAPGQADQAAARARDDFQQMIARARGAGIEVIVATEVTVGPRGDDWGTTIKSWISWAVGRESYEDYINTHVVALNAWLAETAKREGLLLLDLKPVLSDSRGQRTRESRTADGAHITPAGYAAVTAYARPLLEQHFRQDGR